jgi:hypothetical protein
MSSATLTESESAATVSLGLDTVELGAMPALKPAAILQVEVAVPQPQSALDAPKLKTKWEKIAYSKIAPAYKITSKVKMPLVRNKLINRAYVELYESDPATFKWAGLAVFASHSIGVKLELLRTVSIASKAALVASFGTALSAWYLNSQLDYLYKAVSLGNKMIFTDIYWQHLAYRDGGIEELERIHQQGDLSTDLLRAWQLLDQGKKAQDEEIIWKANIDLLYHEQHNVVHPILYGGEKNTALWKKISKADDILDALMTSPVPFETKLFRDCVPNGNLANFTERWKWCTESIMPRWREFETSEPQTVKLLHKKIVS